MQSGIRTHFFLGADSRCGYYSLYGSLLSSALCETQYIIKGGHAFGKSDFFNKLAELVLTAGYDVECYRGASDPECLDGIFIPAVKTAFIDGETPHAVNAQYPGAIETYIDLGALYDSSGLRKDRDSVVALTGEMERARQKLSRYLRAAGEVRDNISNTVKTEKIVKTIRGRASKNGAREMKKTGGGAGRVSYRFLNESSGSDASCDYSAATARCGRICVLDNDFGLSSEMLPVLIRRAEEAGFDAVVCLDPLEPDRAEHLMIPALSLAYISKKSHQDYTGEVYKHFRLDALPRESLSHDEKLKIKADRKLFSALIRKADEAKTDIKRLTAELGAIYAPRLDSGGVIELAEEYARAII